MYRGSSYKMDRQSFLSIAKNHRAAITSYVLKGYKGPSGEDLAVDVAAVGPKDAALVILMTSGIHGVELPFGSRLQRDWLKEAAHLCHGKANVRFVFAHALNPFGAAYGLRGDQQNIDLNRNFVRFPATPETASSYRALAKAFAPNDLSFLSLSRSWVAMAGFVLANGQGKFKQALAGGQYTYPDGLYYGGKDYSWTHGVWNNILEREIPERANALWHIDLHTGEGAFGDCKVLVNAPAGSEIYERARKIAPPLFVTSTASALAQLSGDIADETLRFAAKRPGMTATPMALEFGTSNFLMLDVLRAMILRNTLYVRHGDAHPRAGKIIQNMHALFYPPSDKWRQRAEKNANVFWLHLKAAVPA